MKTVAMVSDFFYTNIGGVESHIYYLSACLVDLGYRVVIITRARLEHKCTGIRYINKFIKVYYVPAKTLGKSVIFSQIASPGAVLLWNIFNREKIDIMHCHASSSVLAISFFLVAKIMKIPVILTEHSLYDLNIIKHIFLNHIYQVFVDFFINRVICVSNTVRENFIMRTYINPSKTFIIPNAIDSQFFRKISIPKKWLKNPKKIRIIILSRMTWRKGIDLLIQIMPVICKKFPNVEFMIGGDGVKMNLVKAVIS